MKFEMDFLPTEDESKLIEIVLHLFPDSDYKIKKDKIVGETDGETFWGLVEDQEIKDTIDTEFENGYVDLSKSAAMQVKISIDIGSEIGKIRLYK